MVTMDPVKAAQAIYQAKGRAPSVRQLVKAGVRKAEIYQNYGGIGGLCKAAGVPLSGERFERVETAMKSHRAGAPQPVTEEKPSGSIYKEQSHAWPVQQLPQYPPPTQPPHPQQQPTPAQPASPIVIKVETRAEDALTKEGIEEGVRAIVQEMLPKTKEAPVEEPTEVDIKAELKRVFQESRRKGGGWGEVIAAAKESQEKIKEIFKNKHQG